MGGKIKRLFVSLSLCAIIVLMISTTCVEAQQLPEIQSTENMYELYEQLPGLPSIENMDVDITLELLPDARCHVTVSAEAQFEMGEFPITSGSLNLRVSSPSLKQIKFDVTGNVTITEASLDMLPDEISVMLSMMNVDMINDSIASLEIEGKYLYEILGAVELPPEAADIKIEEIRCTKLSWREPTIEAGLTTTLSGSVFEKKVDLSLDINITAEDNTMTIELTLNGYFDLPKVGGNVQWSFETPEIGTIPGLEYFALENLGESFAQYNTDFTLKVPENASVSGLPLGYSQTGNTYTWSGGNAADALNTVLAGETQPNIVYGYEAPPESPLLTVGILVVIIVAIVAAIVLIRR